MGIELLQDHARQLRFRAQNLAGEVESGNTVAEAVHDCCGVQAQDAKQAPLSIRARSSGLTAADVERARIEDRSIARAWCMRGTRHYVLTEDLPWLRSLFGPLYVKRGQRRLTQLGLDERMCEQALGVLREAFASEGSLTRHDVADRLRAAGFEFDPDGQAPIHIVRRVCLEGIAIEAASRDGEETYALAADWVALDPPPDRKSTLAELARRYVAAYEPATPDDLYSWSGLYKRDVRTGWNAIEDELTEVDIGGERAWTISSPDVIEFDDAPIVRLLPMYDSYFLGHQDRDLVLPDEYAERVYPGGGVIRATVLIDGLAAGTWKFDRTGSVMELVIELFEPLNEAVESRIEAEVEDVGRFLGTEIEYQIAVQG